MGEKVSVLLEINENYSAFYDHCSLNIFTILGKLFNYKNSPCFG